MATDLLGFGSNATNVRTARPAETRLFGATDTWGGDCSSPTAGDGTRVPAALVNGLLAQLRQVIRQGGVTEDNTDDQMVWKAVVAAVSANGGIHKGTDTGAVNALVVTVAPVVAAYVDGHVYEITPLVTTTAAAPTINISGLGAKTIVHPDGSALLAGEIVAGAKFLAAYDSTLGKIVLLGAQVAQPYAIGLLSATTVPSATTTMLTIGAPATSNGFTLTANRLVIPRDGLYLVTASVGIAGATASGVLSARRRSAADADLAWNVFGLLGYDGSGAWANSSGVYRFSAGELLAWSLIQYSGSTQTTTGGGHYFIRRIGD